MFNFLKRIFRRGEADRVAVAAHVSSAALAPPPRVAEKPAAGGIEVATLSLRAILEKLPPDLRAIVNQLPDAAVKIMLPVNTILKQLPAGAVRMSLASLVRQAPQGTFKKTAIEEKQMVDIPLGEVFKCVPASRLTRRSDQRRYDVPEDAPGLFGKNGAARKVNPAAPGSGIVERPPADAPPASAPPPRIEPQRVMRMPGIAPASPAVAELNVPAVPPPPAPAAKSALTGAASPTGELVISFVELAAGWPEGVRSELSLLPGDTKLVIPAPSVSAGLQKGKVTFPWSQVRAWLRPAMTGSPAIADNFELVFPLRIMAPAFVAATGATKRREAAKIDQSLPDFFGPTAAAALKAEPPAPAPAPASALVVEAAVPVPAALVPAAPEPVVAPLKFTIVCEEPRPITEAVPAAPTAPALAATPLAPVAEVSASPAEIVAHACALAGVAGAIVALEEGLVVAEKMPPGVSADTFAAFMPQIFGRLEKYTAEMQLGATTEITLQSEHGPCHLARRGKIYFGTLGRAGERLPEGLGELANRLATSNS